MHLHHHGLLRVLSEDYYERDRYFPNDTDEEVDEMRKQCDNRYAPYSLDTARNIHEHLKMFNTFECQNMFLTRFNKIATQGAPQMAVDKEANSLSRVYSYYSKFNMCLFYV